MAVILLFGQSAFSEVAGGLGALSELKDQHGDPGGLSTEADGIQIAIVVSAKRLRRIKPWERAILEFDDTLELIRIADVPRSTPTEYQRVAEKLRKRLPDNVNVLIDLKGVWVSEFRLDSSTPNILVFDRAGRLLAQHAGMYKRALFDALQADLELIQSGALAAQAPSQEP